MSNWLPRLTSDFVLDGNQQCITPFNDILAQDISIRPKIIEILEKEKEKQDRLLNEDFGQVSTIGSLRAIRGRRAGTNVSISKRLLASKTKQIQTVAKLYKSANTSMARVSSPNRSTASGQAKADEESEEEAGHERSLFTMGRGFVDRQLRAARQHLAAYDADLKARVACLKQAVVDKARDAAALEACLARFTSVISKLPPGHDLGFTGGSHRQSVEHERSEGEESIAKGGQQDAVANQVWSYGCLVKTFEFEADFPLARACPYVTAYSVEVDQFGKKDNKVLICGGFGLRLMSDSHTLGLGSMAWERPVG
jgi:hypothetical protein